MNNRNITDMTAGSPARHILRFSLPLLIGNLFQQLYNMVDSIVVGNYVGKDALAAVGTCSSMNFLFFSLSSGLAIGIGIIVSQYFGAKDEKNVRSTIANSFFVLAFVSLFVSLAGILSARGLLILLQTPEHILGDAAVYMRTTCAGILGIALYNGTAAILRALGDSKTPLYFLILSSIANVVLDLTFVLALGLGVFGVALATVISQAVSAVTSLLYAYRRVPYFHLRMEELKPHRAIIEKSFRLGIPVALQNSMIAVSCMVLQGVVNSFGDTVMAAYTITNRVEQIVQQPYGSHHLLRPEHRRQPGGPGEKGLSPGRSHGSGLQHRPDPGGVLAGPPDRGDLCEGAGRDRHRLQGPAHHQPVLLRPGHDLYSPGRAERLRGRRLLPDQRGL